MDHADLRQLIAGGALDDLEAQERRIAAEHLRACAECRALRMQLAELVVDLGLLATPRRVPAALGARIVAMLPAVDAGGGSPRAVTAPLALDGPGTDRMTAPARRGAARRPWPRIGFMPLAVAAAAIAAIAVLGVHGLDLQSQLTEARRVATAATAAIAARESAMAVVADPAHSSAWLEPQHGGVAGQALVVYLPGSSRAYLLAAGLPATPAGRVYQFWYADTVGVHPGVTFDYDGRGTLLIPVDVDLRGAQAAMLTLEPTGGAASDPSQDVVFGNLPAS
jgi:hypothetical protein